MTMRTFTGLSFLPALLGLQSSPQRTSIEQALNQMVQFELAESTFTDACAALTRQTGVPIAISPEALDVLPVGGDTKVRATLRNISLREGLTRFLAPLCMSYEVTGAGVNVVAHPALLRLGRRRATWKELDTLRALQQLDWRSAPAAAAFQSRLQFRVPAPAPMTQLSNTLARAGPGPGDAVLTEASRAMGWTWFPQDDHIVVLTDREQTERMLRGRVSLRATHRPLVEVIEQLARQARVPIRAEPGAVAALPPQTRENFSLLAERITLAQALEQVAAATGLTYRIDEDAVVFSHPGTMGPPLERVPPAPRTSGIDPVVAKLVLPPQAGGLQLEILIRESELSTEANQARKKLIKDADEIFVMELNRRAAAE